MASSIWGSHKGQGILALVFYLAFLSCTASGAATITIINADSPGVGFNDATPASPVGGNSGTTIGQQRLIAFQTAGNKWGATLTSAVTIRVNATWTALTCTASSAVLGSAGAATSFRDFTNAPVAGHWYAKALANKLAGTEINFGYVDINANFNVNLGKSGCLTGLFFYLGLDNNHGNSVDLISVILHEFAHGLGFATTTNGQTGAQAGGFPNIWDDYLFDNSTNKNWTSMTNAERVASAINTTHLVWNGVNVTFSVPQVLQSSGGSFLGADSMGRARMYSPNSFQAGSSVSHFDTTMTPNQIMEPAINANLQHEVTPPIDLTFPLLKDIGWNIGATQFPDLTMSANQTGTFTQGQVGASYSVMVTNTGNTATNGTVSIGASLPLGLSLSSMSGVGWTCSTTCGRNDALAPGASFPPVTVVVNVAANAPAQLTTQFSAWGGGSVPESANDVTNIVGTCNYQVNPAGGTVQQAGGSASLSVTANAGCSWNAFSNTSWLTVTAGSFGNGPATVTYSAPGNFTSGSRTGSLTVAGQTFTVVQASPRSNVGIFRSGYFWLQDVDGDRQFISPPDRGFAFGGVPGDIPITGDWNGSGTTKVGVYRASSGIFLLDYDGDGQFTAADKAYNLGLGTQPGDIPVVGDWNGDGKTKVGLFRGGFLWILDYNGNGVFEQGIDRSYAFGGVAGDLPVVGDWNGTGFSKIGLFRAGYFWILDVNGNGVLDNVNLNGGDRTFAYGGIPGDLPVVGDWNGDGKSKVGVFRSGYFWVLDFNGNNQFDGTGTDLAFPFGGISGDIPVVGKW